MGLKNAKEGKLLYHLTELKIWNLSLTLGLYQERF